MYPRPELDDQGSRRARKELNPGGSCSEEAATHLWTGWHMQVEHGPLGRPAASRNLIHRGASADIRSSLLAITLRRRPSTVGPMQGPRARLRGVAADSRRQRACLGGGVKRSTSIGTPGLGSRYPEWRTGCWAGTRAIAAHMTLIARISPGARTLSPSQEKFSGERLCIAGSDQEGGLAATGKDHGGQLRACAGEWPPGERVETGIRPWVPGLPEHVCNAAAAPPCADGSRRGEP